MSSTIIPGVSEELGFMCIQSYKDEGLRFKFTGIATSSNGEVKHFLSCFAAVSLLQEENYKCFDDIYLNRSDGSTIKLDPAEVTALVMFEQDELLFQCADNMSISESQDAVDEEEYDTENWDGDAEEDNAMVIVEDKSLLEAENQSLRVVLTDACDKVLHYQNKIKNQH